jgi:hypothetical protein
MRNSAGEYERETGKKVSIPITVRYVVTLAFVLIFPIFKLLSTA